MDLFCVLLLAESHLSQSRRLSTWRSANIRLYYHRYLVLLPKQLSFLLGKTLTLVIGGGTAGLTVASRLVESGNATVAVIEAGELHRNDSLIDLPSDYGLVMGNSSYDWEFKSVPQQYLIGQTLPLARGKLLGGSTGINYLAWVRASIKEYDAWETLGNPGWNWESLLPYFKKSEMAIPGDPKIEEFPGIPNGTSLFDPAFHGEQGYIHVSDETWYSNITANYVETMNNLGVSTNPEPVSSFMKLRYPYCAYSVG